jgi:hypothetical protein
MTTADSRYPHRTAVLGRLVLTTCRQGANAPMVDGCTSRAVDGWTAGGWCIRLHATPGPGLVVAWRGWSGPSHALIRRLAGLPLPAGIFRMRFRRGGR